ncbi:hypothetical protein PGT21_009578 [Puccinia graminis f. sp. tritici]|uniref:Secreted protein n=1 Tax=Puccinia graminis f. sp. tritici TaxID=56615 RepID=A0A5B0N869_PUCGR|nr:hypothetical protein PGT21_009578 [Puccinia graminis f. sp. tritici]KAA1135926.1 hypothetical protein PGTUg99_001366 [Puccinia graminis f. sp. tritici]
MRLCANFIIFLFSLSSGSSATGLGKNPELQSTWQWIESGAGPSGTKSEVPHGSYEVIDLGGDNSDKEIIDVHSEPSEGSSLHEVIDVDSITSKRTSKRPYELIDLESVTPKGSSQSPRSRGGIDLNFGPSDANDAPDSAAGNSLLMLKLGNAAEEAVKVSLPTAKTLNREANQDIRFDSPHRFPSSARPQHEFPAMKNGPGASSANALPADNHGEKEALKTFVTLTSSGLFDFQSRFFKIIVYFKKADAEEKALISEWWTKIDSELQGESSLLNFKKHYRASSSKGQGRSLLYLFQHAKEITAKIKNPSLKVESLRQTLEGLIARASQLKTIQEENKYLMKLEKDEYIVSNETLQNILNDPKNFLKGQCGFIDQISKLDSHLTYLQSRLKYKGLLLRNLDCNI